jgi:NAD(P)-dependent dehydrogenase (short-subunit alcohol dehydrogenase family)
MTEPTRPETEGAVTLADGVVVVVGGETPLTIGLSRGVLAAGGRVARVGPDPAAPDALGPPDRVMAVSAQLSERPEVFRALEQVAARFGSLQALVFAWVPLEATREMRMADMDDAHFDAVWEQVMRAELFCFQAAYGHFRAQGGGGRLMAVVPTIAMSGGPGYSASAAAAEGQRLLVKSAARQWGEDGVTANTLAVAPGLVIPDAPNFERSLAERALGRLGDPETDLGPVVAFLAGAGGGFVTGTTLFVDGGLWMSAA